MSMGSGMQELRVNPSFLLKIRRNEESRTGFKGEQRKESVRNEEGWLEKKGMLNVLASGEEFCERKVRKRRGSER